MKLMILDGNSIMNRAYYGVPLLATRDGTYTNAVIGFLNIMEKMRSEDNPDALCVAFDLHGKTFRHEKYDGYKATRHGMPEELASQMPLIKEVLTDMNIPIYTAQGWEADDVLGTVGRICGEKGWECVVITGDRDSLQLVDPHVNVRLIITKGGTTNSTLYTEAQFREEYGFEPKRLIDLKALMGDSSDNIPGVPGVGKKTASDLLLKYGSLSGVYAHLDEQRESLRNKLEAGRESALMSFDLATIVPEAPVDFTPEDCLTKEPKKKELRELFEKLQCFRQIEFYHLRDEKAEEQKAAAVILDNLPEPEPVMALLLADGRMAAASSAGAAEGAIDLDYLRRLTGCGKLICADCKSLYRYLDANGIPRPGHVFDASLAGYALAPSESSYAPDKLTIRYLSEQPSEQLAAQADALYRLCPVLEKLLSEQGLETVYRDIDLPLCTVLADMEEAGALVDRKQLEDFRVMLEGRIAGLQQTVYDYAGESFNINSTRKLGEILFEKLNLPGAKKTKTGYSTNADVLEKLRPMHPIVDAVLEYRQLTKLQSTYAEGLMKCIDSDGRIRTTFQNMVTATGRLSSTDPNLQNIPVRTELGAEIRKMFIAKPGYVLVDADYSQIELRVLAHIANDTAMRDAFLSGADFHTVTASQVFGVPVAEVTPLMRRSAKAVNFGIVYGITKWSLSEDLHVTPYEAEQYINTYLSRFSGVRQYMQDVVANAKETGYVTTMYGRKRALPELKSSNFMVRSGAERMALNTPVQGSAADIIKLAMLRIAKVLPEECPEARLILQVHDELIVECPEADAERVGALLSREMQAAADLSVPLIAEAKYGKNWYEAK